MQVSGVLAYLPQYLGEISEIALVASFALGSLPALITGRASVVSGWSPRRVRATACLVVLAAAGLCLFIIYSTPAEPSGGYPGAPGGRWGTTSAKAVMAVWLFAITAITAWNLRREMRFLRGDSRARKRTRDRFASPS